MYFFGFLYCLVFTESFFNFWKVGIIIKKFNKCVIEHWIYTKGLNMERKNLIQIIFGFKIVNFDSENLPCGSHSLPC